MGDFAPISDAELAFGFECYCWGNSEPNPRDMMATGLLQRAAGFAIGGTLSQCLVKMRLLGPRTRKLTKRGRLVLYDCFAKYTKKGHP